MSDENPVDRVPKMLTLPEAAKALRCSPRSLYGSGWPERLGAVKVGNKWLVPETAVVEVLNGKRADRPGRVSEGSERSEHPERHTSRTTRDSIEQQQLVEPALVVDRFDHLCAAAEKLISRGCCEKLGDAASLDAIYGWEIEAKALLEHLTDAERLRRLRGLRRRVSRITVSHYNDGHDGKRARAAPHGR